MILKRIASFSALYLVWIVLFLLFNCIVSWKMKSLKNFFPVVENVSNKRQKISETAMAVRTSEDLATAEKAKEFVNVDEIREKGPIVTETIVEAPTATLSVPAINWTPFNEMEITWRSRLQSEYGKPYFQRLLGFLEAESKSQTIFPPCSQIFTALNLCPYDKVKVVIIGQDPYHGPGQAHGLAFSVQKGVTPPPSLRNMFTELQNDPEIDFPKPTHGNLEHWSRQGVMLLNTVLTVRKADANSHQKKGWEEFTDAIVRELRKKEGIVYLLWGKPAQSKCSGIDRSKNVILQSSHPSPLAAYKTSEPFMGSRMFSKCNKALKELGQDPIDWSIL